MNLALSRTRGSHHCLTSGFAIAIVTGSSLAGTSAQAAAGRAPGWSTAMSATNLRIWVTSARFPHRRRRTRSSPSPAAEALLPGSPHVKNGKGRTTRRSASTATGYNGIADAGQKREGDGMTPSEAMGYGFGVQTEPEQFHGSKYVQGTKDDVWVDGDAAKDYNTMQKKSDGYSGESMYQTPACNHGQVIGYNSAGTPGTRSAVFLHVNTGSQKTAGCVSVSEADLLKIYEWEDDSAVEMAISK